MRIVAVNVVMLPAACGARTALEVTPAETSSTSASTATSVYTTSFTATATPVNEVCKGGEVLCNQCDGGTYCATACPLIVCPIDMGSTPPAVEAGAPCDDAGATICNFRDICGNPTSICTSGPCPPSLGFDCPGTR